MPFLPIPPKVGTNLRRHPSVGGTLPLTETSVATDTAGGSELTGAGTRVHGDGLADDEAIGDELADGVAGVGVGDLVDLVRVEPDLALAAVGDGRRKALLRAEVDPARQSMLVLCPWCGFLRAVACWVV